MSGTFVYSNCKNRVCNFTHLTSLVPTEQHNTVCADSGSTDILLRQADIKHCTPNPHHKINVRLPNGNQIQSLGTIALTLPHIPTPLRAHVFNNAALNTSLLSLAEMCNSGCTVTLTDTSITVTRGAKVVLQGTKSAADKLWFVNLSCGMAAATTSSDGISVEPTAHNTVSLPADRDFVAYAHKTLGSPALTTLRNALHSGFLATFPRLTEAMLAAHPPSSIATAKGHLDQHRQGQHSTRQGNTTSRSTGHMRAGVLDTKNVPLAVHSDLTGKFPVASQAGNQYVLVSTMDGYIHVEPMASRHYREYIQAFRRTIEFFKHNNQKPTAIRIDNETSKPLEQYLHEQGVTVQYVPPHQHRANSAERAIRTFKNHFIATLCTVAEDFPITLWDELLHQAEVCLNHLRHSKSNPAISAYAAMHGSSWDFAAHPMAPAGCKVVIHDKPSVRPSWAAHGVTGFYLGPAMQHYRCYRVFSSTTASIRITDTVAWIDQRQLLYDQEPQDRVRAALEDLSSALRALPYTVPAATCTAVVTQAVNTLLTTHNATSATAAPQPDTAPQQLQPPPGLAEPRVPETVTSARVAEVEAAEQRVHETVTAARVAEVDAAEQRVRETVPAQITSEEDAAKQRVPEVDDSMIEHVVADDNTHQRFATEQRMLDPTVTAVTPTGTSAVGESKPLQRIRDKATKQPTRPIAPSFAPYSTRSSVFAGAAVSEDSPLNLDEFGAPLTYRHAKERRGDRATFGFSDDTTHTFARATHRAEERYHVLQPAT